MIPEPSDHMLIVSLQSISGLRQTFYQNQEFKISRLVQMPRYGTEPYAPYISDEVEKIRRYINSFTIDCRARTSGYSFFWQAGELLEELKEQHSDTEAVKYHTVDLNELSRKPLVLARRSRPRSAISFLYIIC